MSKNRKIKKKKTVRDSALKKFFSFIWDLLFYVFFILILAGAIVFNFNDSPDKSFFGYRFMTVLTDSMSPNPKKPQLKDGFSSGSIIIIKNEPPEKIKEGDIITFYPVQGKTDAYLTHRVIEKMDELDGEKGVYFKTQGDANTGADIPIKANQVVGKVILSIPFVGNILNFIRDNIVTVAIFIALLFGFIVMLKYYLGMKTDMETISNSRVNLKKKKRKKISSKSVSSSKKKKNKNSKSKSSKKEGIKKNSSKDRKKKIKGGG